MRFSTECRATCCWRLLYSPTEIAHGLVGSFSFVNQAHEFEAEGVDKGAPTGIDDVIGDADGGPALGVVGPFDEDAHFGFGAAFGAEDTDFVIGEADLRDGRVNRGEALAQADIKSVNGAAAGSSRRVDGFTYFESDAGSGECIAVVLEFGAHFVVDDIEGMEIGVDSFAHQEFKGAFGGFEIVALVFHLLDALQNFAAGGFGEILIFEAELFELVSDVSAAG